MKASSQIHAPAALPPLIKQDVKWAPEMAWSLLEFLTLVGKRTTTQLQ